MRYRLLAGIVLLVLIFGFAPARGAVPVRVATWNIEVFDGTDTVQFNAIRDTLLRISPDLIGLQEVASNPAFVNLANATGYTCLTCRFLASANGDIDINADWSGVMVKYPYNSAMTKTSAMLSGDPSALDITRNFVLLTVQIPGAAVPLTISGNHWKASSDNADEFRRSIESIRAMQTVVQLDSTTTPFFVVGDMNDDISEPPDSPAMFTSLPSGLPASFHLGNDISLPIANSAFAPLSNASGTNHLTFIDALQKDGAPVTFPGSNRRLDYIWRSDAVTLVGAEVYDSADEGLPGGLPKYGNPLPPGTSAAASDHLLVFADVMIASFTASGDINDDGVVNLADYAILRNCLTGPQSPSSSNCSSSDLDQDADVDLHDAALLFNIFTLP